MVGDFKEQLEKFQFALDKLKASFEAEITAAYERGWDNGLAQTPDYKTFHKLHQQPQYYGEDGEIVVITGKYGNKRAVDEIYKLLKDDIDITKDEVWDNTTFSKVALSVGNEECEYYVSGNREGVFDAWIWKA